MTLLYTSLSFLEHDTGAHSESPKRLRAIIEHLETTGLAENCERPNWTAASIEQIARNHDSNYIESVAQFARSGGGNLDADTVVCDQSFEVARFAAGATCDAVRRVIGGEDRAALCLVRPPGHHAVRAAAMGFCLFNNVAVAARAALAECALDRVLIVDWDVHHGNGTQDAFYNDGRVGFLSMHRWPFYPGSGAADETGAGDGLGATMNLPIPFGSSRQSQLDAFENGLEKMADRIKPQLIFISAGFDSHAQDPIGSLGLETEDFATLTQLVRNVADAHSDGRIVSVLEGGYNPPILAECVAAHLSCLLDRA